MSKPTKGRELRLPFVAWCVVRKSDGLVLDTRRLKREAREYCKRENEIIGRRGSARVVKVVVEEVPL